MTFLLLLTIVSIVAFLVYKFVLKNLKEQEKETIEKNMKDYDKYHNKLEELNVKIKELSEIGIKGYANKFVWEKFKSSIILKFSILTPIISSFVITVQKLEPIYHIISLLIPLGLISFALILYRVINVEKLAKEGSSKFLELMTLYKKEYIDVEYNKVTAAIKSLTKTSQYTINSLNLLKNFNKLYLDVLDVIKKQSSMNNNVKANLLEKVNESFQQGIDIANEIYDILLVEDKIDKVNINSVLKEKSDKNILDLEKYLDVLEKINNSLAITILDIPKVSNDKSSIDEAKVSLESLEASMELALNVQKSLKEYSFNNKTMI